MHKVRSFNLLGILLSYFAAIACFADDAGLQKELNYWKTTSLNYGLLTSRFINDGNCLSSENSFLGCVDALSFLAERQKSGEAVILLSSLHNVAPSDIIVRSGDLIIAKDRQLLDLKTKKITGVAAYEARKAYLKETDKSWLAVFANYRRLNLPFVQTLYQVAALVDPKLEPMLAGNALNKYLASIQDAHSYIRPTALEKDQERSRDENFVGIGVIIDGDSVGGALRLQKIIEGSPAEKAGLQQKDLIVAIDGKTITAMAPEKSIDLVRGPVGTRVALTVSRGAETINFKVPREEVNVPNLLAKVIQAKGAKVGYLRLNAFMGQNLCFEFSAHMARFQNDNLVKGVIVDLRGNGGGQLGMVACMLDVFLPSGRVVISMQNPDTGKVIDEVRTRDDRVIYRKTLTVLTDGFSASASEIFAGAVQDYKLGYTVGARTFGKGTVQDLREDHSFTGVARAKTIARFHLPSGRTNQIVGIQPDFEAYIKPHPSIEDKFWEREEDRFRRVIKSDKTERTSFMSQLENTRKCMATGNLNQKAYESGDDYMILTAQDVIACDRPVMNLASVTKRAQ